MARESLFLESVEEDLSHRRDRGSFAVLLEAAGDQAERALELHIKALFHQEATDRAFTRSDFRRDSGEVIRDRVDVVVDIIFSEELAEGAFTFVEPARDL